MTLMVTAICTFSRLHPIWPVLVLAAALLVFNASFCVSPYIQFFHPFLRMQSYLFLLPGTCYVGCNAPLTPKIFLLKPALVVVLDNGANHDSHIRKDLQQPIQTHLPCRVRHKHYPTGLNPMIHQYPNCHQSGSPARHLWVQQQHTAVTRNVLGQVQKMQFGFPRPIIRLDQESSSLAVRNDSLETRLETAPASKDHDGTRLALGSQAMIFIALRGLNNLPVETKIFQCPRPLSSENLILPCGLPLDQEPG